MSLLFQPTRFIISWRRRSTRVIENCHHYTETSEPWSVHLLAVGVRLRSKYLACEATNRGETFAIIVRGREKIFEPSPIPPHKATTPSQRTVDKTLKYPIYDRSSRGSSLLTGDGLRNGSPSTWIVPYGGHQQWTHQRPLTLTPKKVAKASGNKHVSNAHSTRVSLPVGSSIYVNPRLGYLGGNTGITWQTPNPLPFSF